MFIEKLAEQAIYMNIALAPLSRGEVEFQGRIGTRNIPCVVKRGSSQRSSSQVGVKNDAAGVDHGLERIRQISPQLPLNSLNDMFDREIDLGGMQSPGGDFLAQARQNGAGCPSH